jgi:hypothetical protein
MSPAERRMCFNLDELINMAGDLMRIADDLRTHAVEDVNARLIDMGGRPAPRASLRGRLNLLTADRCEALQVSLCRSR